MLTKGEVQKSGWIRCSELEKVLWEGHAILGPHWVHVLKYVGVESGHKHQWKDVSYEKSEDEIWRRNPKGTNERCLVQWGSFGVCLSIRLKFLGTVSTISTVLAAFFSGVTIFSFCLYLVLGPCQQRSGIVLLCTFYFISCGGASEAQTSKRGGAAWIGLIEPSSLGPQRWILHLRPLHSFFSDFSCMSPMGLEVLIFYLDVLSEF